MNQTTKSSDFCSSCLFPDSNCVVFNCGHKACENCTFLSLTSYDKCQEDVNETGEKIMNTHSSITCFICLKGSCKVTCNDFVSKLISKLERLNNIFKCEGCDGSEVNQPLESHMSYCVTCKIYLCGKCEDIHNSINAFSSHLVSKVYNHTTFMAPECKCELENKLKFYCATCRLHVCTQCLILSHLDHNFDKTLPKDYQEEEIIKGQSQKQPPISLNSSTNSIKCSKIGRQSNSKRSVTVKVDKLMMGPEISKTNPNTMLKSFKPRGSKIFVTTKSPFKVLTKEDTTTRRIEVEKLLKEILINLNFEPGDELPNLFYRENKNGFFSSTISEKNKYLSLEGVEENDNIQFEDIKLVDSKFDLTPIINFDDLKPGTPKELSPIREKPDINSPILKSPRKGSQVNKVLDENSLIKPLYKLEKDCSDKLKKNLHNLCILLEFINTLIEDISSMYDKRSYQTTDKLNSNLKELKLYFKRLKTHIDNDKNFSVVQIQHLERTIYECLKKGKEKEKALNRILLKEIVTDVEQVSSKPNSRSNSIKKDSEKSFRMLLSQVNFNHKTNILDLQSKTLVNLPNLSISTLPNIMAMMYTTEKRFYIFWINNRSFNIEAMEIYFSTNCDYEDYVIGPNSTTSKKSVTKVGMTEEKRKQFILVGHKAPINQIKTYVKNSSNDYFLLSCSNDGIIRIWKMDSDFRVNVYKIFEFNGINVISCGLQLSLTKVNDKSEVLPILVTCGYKKNYPIQVFNSMTGEQIKEIEVKGQCFFVEIIEVDQEVSKSGVNKGKIFLMASIQGLHHELNIYEFGKFNLFKKIRMEAYINSLFYTEEYGISTLIVNDRNGRIIKLDLESGASKKKLKENNYYGISRFDAQNFFACSKTSLEVIDIKSMGILKKYSNQHKEAIHGVQASQYPAKGICIFTISEDKTIKRWSSSE